MQIFLRVPHDLSLRTIKARKARTLVQRYPSCLKNQRFLIESVSLDFFRISIFYRIIEETLASRCNFSAFLRCFWNASPIVCLVFYLYRFCKALQFSRFRLERFSYMQRYRFDFWKPSTEFKVIFSMQGSHYCFFREKRERRTSLAIANKMAYLYIYSRVSLFSVGYESVE